jgi:hypothetical protein
MVHTRVRRSSKRRVVIPAPESYTRGFAGALRGVYGDVAEIRDYLRKERASWDRQSPEFEAR